MKKTFLVVLLAVMALVFVNGVSTAAITGTCGTCHTMHNSQDGANVTLDDSGAATSTPRDNLLIGGCVYCHVDGAAKTTAAGGWDVANAAANFPSGYFGATTANSHVTVETVGAAISAADGFYDTSTPGTAGGAGIPAGSDELTCSGTVGCHMRTAGTFHHSASAPYRFLSNVTGLSADLSLTNMETTTNHNVYRSDEMNSFCAICHGDFHGTANTGAASPFVRHPTDNAVTGDWATPTVSYNNNPWGFTSTAGLSTATAYTSTGGQVMCVSCHRAHGSAEADNLRFTYANQNAGTAGTGCQGCHNK